jgi:hypothetical protein
MLDNELVMDKETDDILRVIVGATLLIVRRVRVTEERTREDISIVLNMLLSCVLALLCFAVDIASAFVLRKRCNY